MCVGVSVCVCVCVHECMCACVCESEYVCERVFASERDCVWWKNAIVQLCASAFPSSIGLSGAKQREQPGKFEPHLYDPSGLKHPVGPRSYTKGAQVQPQQINKDVTMRSDYPGAQRHKPGLLVFDLRKSRVQGRWRVSLCVCVVL